MDNKSNSFFEYIYTDNGEAFMRNTFENKRKPKQSITMLPLGTCYCSLLNAKPELYRYIEEFRDKYKKIKILEKSTISTILNDLIKISPYFEVLELSFMELKFSSGNTILKCDIEDIFEYIGEIMEQPDNYYYILTDDYDDTVEKSIKRNKIKSYAIPSVSVIDIYVNKKREIMHSYTIKNVQDLLFASAYELFNAKYHLKKCLYCGKYFTSKVGQTKFCNYPNPIDPSKTCREITKCIKDNNNSDIIFDKKWVSEIYELDYFCNNTLRGRFRDCANIEKNEEKKRLILENKAKFSKIKAKLRKQVISSDKSNRNYYLNIYKRFVNQIDQNTKSTPKNFIVEEPNFKNK